MAQVGGAIRRGSPRLEIRVPLTWSVDISFGIVLRKPRRRRHKRSAIRRWTATVVTAACCVITAVIPIWTVIAAPELERLGALALAKPQPPIVTRLSPETPERAVLVARGARVSPPRIPPPAPRRAGVLAGGRS